EALDPDRCLPAPGQGAIAVETLAGGEWEVLARRATDAPTEAATRAERAFLAALGGGCATPVGALATVDGGRLRLRGVVIEGGAAQRVEAEGDVEEPEAVGIAAARQVR